MNKEFYIKNRKKLSDLLPDKSVAVLMAGHEICRSLDEAYDFSVNRSFYYFTGINEENDILLIVKENGKARSILFINPYDELKAKWVGRKLLRDEVIELSGVDAVRYIREFDEAILEYAKDGFEIHMDTTKCLFDEPYTPERYLEEKLNKEGIKVLNLRSKIVDIRMVKEPEELDEMRKAINLTRLGLEAVMKNLKAGLYEYQVESYFDQSIKFNGCSDFAFKTIAASGKNACVLHYHTNDSLIPENSLMLFDLGAEYNLYKSDISRTYPVSGKFSPKQKQIYEIVLNAQKEAFNAMKPGVTIKELNQVVINFYAKELKKIGLIKDDSEVTKYYFHSVSHHIGLDTHDISGRDLPLKAGSVISNEPGLYIPEFEIGIRIEDDVLITENGAEWLSKEIIKEVNDIENFMANNK